MRINAEILENTAIILGLAAFAALALTLIVVVGSGLVSG